MWHLVIVVLIRIPFFTGPYTFFGCVNVYSGQYPIMFGSNNTSKETLVSSPFILQSYNERHTHFYYLMVVDLNLRK
jgi:hypothetical protein